MEVEGPPRPTPPVSLGLGYVRYTCVGVKDSCLSARVSRGNVWKMKEADR